MEYEDKQCANSLRSFPSSLIITPGTSGFTPTSSIHSGQSTDEFELIADSDEEGPRHAGNGEYDDDSSSMSSASVTPSIFAHEFEHCRRYHSYKSGRYPFPNDLSEQRREETLHYIMLEMAEGHIFLSDVGEWPQKILDIGTGIGTWAVDVADLYPGASVSGTDLSPIQPTWLPVNLRMFVEDCEGEWMHGSNYDLIHLRDVAGTLRDVDGVLKKIYANLAPGGWIEFQDIEPEIFCDDDTMLPTDPLRTFFALSTRGLQTYGLPHYPLLPSSLITHLSGAGFTNVQTITKKIPISPWARDRNLLAAGVLAKEWVSETIDAMTAKPLAALDLNAVQRKTLGAQAKRSLEREGCHRYLKLNFVMARKEERMAACSDSESFLSMESM